MDIPYEELLSAETPIPHDVVFRFENSERTVSAHRLVLSLASPYFRCLFYGPFEAIPQPHTIDVFDFSLLVFERMIYFVYASLANKNEEYVLVDEKENITGQEDIKIIIETNRVADYYGLTSLVEVCAEAMERIRVTRQNVEWLESFLRLGPGEEELQEKVVEVREIMNQLEARREGRVRTRLRSYKHHRFGQKSEEWLNHQLNGHTCDIVVLKGPTGSSFSNVFIGTYKMFGSHNERPLYKMIDDKAAIYYDFELFIYYEDGYWAAGHDFITLLKIPDTSIQGGPPVYTPSTMFRYPSQQFQPETRFSLSCGHTPVCEKIQVSCDDPDFVDPSWLGEYEATGTYCFGVMLYQNRNGTKLNSLGFLDHFLFPFTGQDKQFCPCQAQKMMLDNYEVEVTCSAQHCLCSHHAS